MSLKSNRLGCTAGGASFYDYGYHKATRPGPDGRTQCPVCGKPIQLRAAQPGFRRYIPHHHKATGSAA